MSDKDELSVNSDKIDRLSTKVDGLNAKFDQFIDSEQQRRSMSNFGGSSVHDADTMPRKYDQNDSEPHIHKAHLNKDHEKQEIEQAEADRTQVFGVDENEERGNWTGQLDFLLSCLGYAVGLGNVWRFPYLCYKNGGGAFLIPYAIALVFVGLPIFLMELSLGQFTSLGPLNCWKFSAGFTGVGYGMVIVSSMVAIYYNMIIAWAFYYLFASFTSDLPWQYCNKEWNTKYCAEALPLKDCRDTTQFIRNVTDGLCYFKNGTLYSMWNSTAAASAGIKRAPASQEYFERFVLAQSDELDLNGGLGKIKWQLCLCFLLAFIICFLCLSRGIKSSGRVVYFTALFPYVVLVILFIYGLTLPGSGNGIRFYIIPDFSRLTDAKIWYDAVVQIFFSLSACWGGLIALSSYNRFHNNVLRDSLIVCFGNCATSFFAGFVIFSFLGYLSEITGISVDQVATSGAGLAFIIYPDAVTHLPISPFWSILFFMMLITLGLDSQFGLMECVITAALDKWPKLRQYKTWFILVLSIILFLLGLTLATNSGIYIFTLMDTFAGGWSVLVIGFCECMSLSWVYGWDNFSRDIEVMIGRKTSLWWMLCWRIITPGLILFVTFFSWFSYKRTTYGDYIFPLNGEILGWGMSVAVVVPIIVFPIVYFIMAKGSFKERMRYVFGISPKWGPYLVKHRKLVHHYEHYYIVDPNAKSNFELQQHPSGAYDNKTYSSFDDSQKF